MKVVINVSYKRHSDFIQSLPFRNDMFGTILQNKRNTISLIDVGGEKWVAKRFKCPTPFNRFAYTFLRKSKAERAYRNAFRLLEMGYDTPVPIAYIEWQQAPAVPYRLLYLPMVVIQSDREYRRT